MKFLKKWWLLIVMGLITVGIYCSPIADYFTLVYMREVHKEAREWVNLHPIYAVFVFLIVYILYAVLMLPGMNFLDVIGGFLFIQPFSTLFVILGAILGAFIIFSFFKWFFRDHPEVPNWALLRRMKKGLDNSQTHYMLFLRLVPFFPFGMVSAASAYFKVSTKTFIWTTIVGCIPAAFLYTQAGTGLGELLEGTDPITMAHVFNQEMIIALSGIALFALLPIFLLKKQRGRE